MTIPQDKLDEWRKLAEDAAHMDPSAYRSATVKLGFEAREAIPALLDALAMSEAALSAAEAARVVWVNCSVPDGWKLVPVEPTIEMLVEGTEDWLCIRAMEDRAATIWSAMLAASPAAPVPAEGEMKAARVSPPKDT